MVKTKYCCSVCGGEFWDIGKAQTCEDTDKRLIKKIHEVFGGHFAIYDERRLYFFENDDITSPYIRCIGLNICFDLPHEHSNTDIGQRTYLTTEQKTFIPAYGEQIMKDFKVCTDEEAREVIKEQWEFEYNRLPTADYLFYMMTRDCMYEAQ